MAEKGLRRMKRTELIEIIYALKSDAERIRKEKDELWDQLHQRNIKIEEAGSIAEASLNINEVFVSAQAAADDYLNSVKAVNAEQEAYIQSVKENAEQEAMQIILQARQKAEVIEAQAKQKKEEIEEECKLMKEQATKEIEGQWDDYRRKIIEVLDWHKELSKEALNEAGEFEAG